MEKRRVIGGKAGGRGGSKEEDSPLTMKVLSKQNFKRKNRLEPELGLQVPRSRANVRVK